MGNEKIKIDPRIIAFVDGSIAGVKEYLDKRISIIERRLEKIEESTKKKQPVYLDRGLRTKGSVSIR
jgi:hypothetical protein